MKQVYEILTALSRYLGSGVFISAHAAYDVLVFEFRWKQDGQKKQYNFAVSLEEAEHIPEKDTDMFVELIKRKLEGLNVKPEKIHA